MRSAEGTSACNASPTDGSLGALISSVPSANGISGRVSGTSPGSNGDARSSCSRRALGWSWSPGLITLGACC